MSPALIVTLLALLLGLQPITTDLYLPALPGLAADLRAPMAATQMTLSALLFAFGVSQLFLGPAADRFGRRPVLIGGLALYVLASIGSVLAADIGALIGWRALQGVGTGAAVVCARAMVRDLYAPSEGARVMSKALSGLGLIALASPIVGGLIASSWGWRSALGATGVFAAVTLALVAWRALETAPALNPHALRVAPMFVLWARIVRHPTFVAWVLLTTFTYAGLITFLAASSFVFIEVLGRTRMECGLYIAGCSVCYLAGTFACRRWLLHHGLRRRSQAGGRLHARRRRGHGRAVAGRRARRLGDLPAAVRLLVRPRRAPALRPGGGGRAVPAQRRRRVRAGRFHPRRRCGTDRRVARRGHGRHRLPADADRRRDVGVHRTGRLDAGAAPRRGEVNTGAICVAGPTASGKSALVLQLAQRLRGQAEFELVSVDSAQVYRHMDIGTAKPSADERAALPHHLIDILEPEQAYAAANFVRDALDCVERIRARGRVPLLVGGTMLYFKALREGLNALPAADAALRAQLDARAAAEGWPALHAELRRVDPASAARLASNDAQRIQRALEVWLLSGKTLSHWHAQSRAPSAAAGWPLLALLPQSRAWLHARIAARFDAMLEAGLLDEVRALRARPGLARAAAVDALRGLPAGLGRARQRATGWPA